MGVRRAPRGPGRRDERPAALPAGGGSEGEGRQFRYTPMVGQPVPAPPPIWPHDHDEVVIPGYEFDRGVRPVDVFGPHPGAPYLGDFAAGDFDADPFLAYRSSTGPFPAACWGDEDSSGAESASPVPAAPPRPPLPGRAARAEWARLLRSCLPEPAKRTWFTEFRSALHFRGAALRVAVPILVMVVVGMAIVVIAGANDNHLGPVPPPASLGFPPATLAGAEFTAAAGSRGISQTLGRVASDGAEIVAVGSQEGARIARAQFLVTLNDGRSWSMGAVRAAGGGPPPPGYAAQFVAGGRGAWVAIGPGAIWTSRDGQTWTLVSVTGLPLRPGDQISVLKRTAAGFIAAGTNVPGGHQARATPVVFLSADGLTWRRLGAAQLGLAAAGGRVLGIRYAAAYGSQILVAGDVTLTRAEGHGRTVTVPAGAAWLSADGGTTWSLAVRPAVAPPGHGARAQISGVAVTADGFVLARPAAEGTRPALDVYRSPDGRTWTFAATLSTTDGFTPGMVNGAGGGALVTGQAGRTLTAFVSADGASWRQVAAFGRAAAQTVTGAAMAEGGVLVVAGTAASPGGRQPLLTVLAPRAPPVRVDVAAIPGAADRQLAVNAIAAGAGRQVAVGGANGYPAAWVSVNGGTSWTRASGQTQAVLQRPGIQQLTSVTFGPSGWLAVGGGPPAGTAGRPVVVGSANGTVWTAADGEAAFAGPGLFTEQAAAGPGGYVVVGYQVISGRPVAAAWWSAGLAGWARAADPAGAAAAGATQMLAVTAGPRGFTAVGAAGELPSAWTSPDGRAWTRVSLPLPAGAARAVLAQVAAAGRILVAAGTAVTAAGRPLPFAASSSDGGAVWTESALPVPSGRASVTALVATGRGFVATGTFGPAPGHQDVVVWTSASGQAWQAVTPAGPGLTGSGVQAITGLDASGGTLTGIGYSAWPTGEEPVFWQSPLR